MEVGKQLNLFDSPGITIIEPKVEYIHESLQPPDYSVYRIDGGQNRYYYKLKDNDPEFYISVTSLISSTRPTPYNLKKMLADMGWKQYHEFMRERADYGTWMHIMWNRLLIDGKIDIDSDTMNTELMTYIEGYGVKIYKDVWIEDMQHDILAFAQWIKDYDVKPLLIEQPLVHSDGFAGCPDLLCEMTIQETGYWGEVYKAGEKKGQRKETKGDRRITAIVDYKSGRNGFHEENEIQLYGYEKLIAENYPNIVIDRLYDLSPKNWRDKPTYSLKDQTESDVQGQFIPMLEMFKMNKKLSKPPNVFTCEGSVKLGDSIDKLYQEVEIEDVIKDIRKGEK